VLAGLLDVVHVGRRPAVEVGEHGDQAAAQLAGLVLHPAQVTVDAKSDEIPAFTPLLDAVEAVVGTLNGLIFVADALHTQTNHATEIAARGAHLLIPVKGNRPTLHTQLQTLPWAQIPIGHQTRDRGHGRRETRTVNAVTVTTPGGIAFPHAAQAIRITRTRTITSNAKTTRETAYLTISLPAVMATLRNTSIGYHHTDNHAFNQQIGLT